MKKIQSIPILLIVLLSAFSMLVFYSSCTESKQKITISHEYPGITEAVNIEKEESEESRVHDAQFLAETALISLSEIRMGQLAQQKSRNSEVRELAQLMEAEHTKALNEVKALAKQKKIQLPASLDEHVNKQVEELSAIGTSEFDRAYTNTLIKDHRATIMLFESKIRETKDIDINNWIEKTLPDLRKFLEHSATCEKNCV